MLQLIEVVPPMTASLKAAIPRLTLDRTGMLCLPETGAEIRCWVREVGPGDWKAWMLPPEISEWPSTSSLPTQRISPGLQQELETNIERLISYLQQRGNTRTQQQQHPYPSWRDDILRALDRLYVAPLVHLEGSLVVLCDSDIVRLSDRWNLGVDVVSPSQQPHQWYMLLKFHSQLDFRRFEVQLRRYLLCRKPSNTPSFISLAPSSGRRVAASLPSSNCPIFAIDGQQTVNRDDAFQVEESDAKDIVVLRMFIATPLTQEDIQSARGQSSFETALPKVLNDARVKLLGEYGHDMLTNVKEYNLKVAQSTPAACYEQRFDRSEVEGQEQFRPHGFMTVRLIDDCKLDAALTFEQVDAFEDGDLELPSPLEISLRLLRQLMEGYERHLDLQKKQADPSTGAAATPTVSAQLASLAVDETKEQQEATPDPDDTKEQQQQATSGPIRFWMEARSQQQMFYRLTLGVSKTAKSSRSLLNAMIRFFKRHQIEALYRVFGFTLQDSRILTTDQVAKISKFCAARKLPLPADQTYDFKDAFFPVPTSALLELADCDTVETKVPSLSVEKSFWSRLPEDVKRELQSSEPSDSPFWDDKGQRPPRGVRDVKEVEPEAKLDSNSFLVSTHPLREYSHLLAQFLMLLSPELIPSCDPASAAPATALSIDDRFRQELIKYCIAAQLELNFKSHANSANEASTLQTYLCDSNLPYKRAILLNAFLARVGDPLPSSRVKAVFLSRDLRDDDTKKMLEIDFELDSTDPLVKWPDSFGTPVQLFLCADAGKGVISRKVLIRRGDSYASVLTEDDFLCILDEWQGRKLQEIVRADDRKRGVTVGVPLSALPQDTLVEPCADSGVHRGEH